MKRKNTMALFFGAMGMAVLILDSQTAILGCREGVELCLNVLIPSLFPFIFLSTVLVASLHSKSMRILRPLGRITRIPAGAESLLLIGYLGGYPIGAQCINQAYTQGSLSKEDAERMLPFCNNCGPAFLFGMISMMFDDLRMVWALWIIHILSSILAAVSIPGSANRIALPKHKDMSISQALKNSLIAMAQICGWVVLFRIVLTFINHWFGFLIPQSTTVIINGMFELANGCISLRSITDFGERFLACSGMISLGGLCVTVQTDALLHNDISRRLYLPGKILQCAYSIIIPIMLNPTLLQNTILLIPIISAIIYIIIFNIIFRKSKNNSSIFSMAAV